MYWSEAVSYTHLDVYKRQGIKSVIPADEVIDSMRRIGNDMPVCLKETGEGGLAITPTAKVYKQKLNNIDN